jgi:hypothetical protein
MRVPGAPGLDFETWETTDSNIRNHAVRNFEAGRKKQIVLHAISITRFKKPTIYFHTR